MADAEPTLEEATAAKVAEIEKALTMGLGEAVLRLIHVEQMHATGIHQIPQQLQDERAMIVDALNQYDLDLNFACGIPDAPDDVEIFKQTAETSCCRIVPPGKPSSPGGSRRKPVRPAASRRAAPKKKSGESVAASVKAPYKVKKLGRHSPRIPEATTVPTTPVVVAPTPITAPSRRRGGLKKRVRVWGGMVPQPTPA
jgi:hypothetical protein